MAAEDRIPIEVPDDFVHEDDIISWMKANDIPISLENWIELNYWRPASEVLADADAEFWSEVPDELLQVKEPKTKQ